jgi:ABC-type polysaccharide/polyol phosphate export permease
MRVVWALLLREIITRYGRHNIGFMWMFVGPMLLILVIVTIHSYYNMRTIGEISIVGFGVTGYSAAFLWRNMVNRCLLAIEPNLALMYHRNVKVLDIYAARISLEAVGETIAFVLLSTIFIVLGWMDLPVDILKVLEGWIMLSWFGAALGLTLGALSEMEETVAKFWRPLNFATLITSGAFFMVEWLPENVRNVLLYFPMIHGMELVREGYFGSTIHAYYNLGYMAFWCLGLTLAGLLLVRASQYRVTLQ